MNAITLRGVPPEIERMLRRKARETGKSMNRIVLGLLEEVVGSRKRPRRTLYHDLDFLFGVWTREEGAVFDRSLRDQRQIDPELWR